MLEDIIIVIRAVLKMLYMWSLPILATTWFGLYSLNITRRKRKKLSRC